MGYKTLSRVYNEILPGMTDSTTQAVLAALAFRCNDETGLCYPSEETLMQMTHFGKTGITNAIRRAKRKGLLSVVRTRIGTKWGHNNYVINFPLPT